MVWSYQKSSKAFGSATGIRACWCSVFTTTNFSTLLTDFVEQTGISFPVVADENATLWDFDYPQGVSYPYPRDIVVGKDLTIRSIRNSFNVEEMDGLVQQLLAE